MNAQELLDEIFTKKIVYDAAGKEYPLNHNVDRAEGEFLAGLIEKYKPQKTIEVGCAYGISSLFICSALEKTEGARHTIIDPCQSEYYYNIGLSNLRKANIGFFEFFEELSEIALPQLLKEGRKYDLGFIDGDHRFEYTLIDFFYLNRLIDAGGIIVIDDTAIPAVNKAMRYVLNYPSYKQIGRVQIKHSAKRQLFDSMVKGPVKLVSKIFPAKMRHEIFSGSIINSDEKLNLDSSMIALQKVSNDERTWDWFKEF